PALVVALHPVFAFEGVEHLIGLAPDGVLELGGHDPAGELLLMGTDRAHGGELQGSHRRGHWPPPRRARYSRHVATRSSAPDHEHPLPTAYPEMAARTASSLASVVYPHLLA